MSQAEILEIFCKCAETDYVIFVLRGVIMKVPRKMSIFRSVGGVLGMLLLTVSFQNCGKAGFDTELSSTDESSSDLALTNKYGSNYASKVANIPFAYEATFDTISFNSCAYSQLPASSKKGGFYTIKAGAYTTKGGLKINDAFYQYMSDNFSPVYPNTEITREEMKEYLSDSPVNKDTQLILGMRSASNFLDGSKIKSSDSSEAAALPLLSTLATAEILETALNQRVYNSYLATGAGDGVYESYFPFSTELRNFEIDILSNSVGLLSQFMTNASSSMRIILGYSVKDSDEMDVLNPNTGDALKSISKAYGRAYKFSFTAPYRSGAHLSNPQTVLSSVSEYDLLKNSTTTGSWTCDPLKRLVVVRWQDLQNDPNACIPMSIDELNSNGNREKLAVIRRHLPADKWDVSFNSNNRYGPCAVAKQEVNVSCYDESEITKISKISVDPNTGVALSKPIDNPYKVQYDLTYECSQPETNIVPSNQLATLRLCAKFISFCERN